MHRRDKDLIWGTMSVRPYQSKAIIAVLEEFGIFFTVKKSLRFTHISYYSCQRDFEYCYCLYCRVDDCLGRVLQKMYSK